MAFSPKVTMSMRELERLKCIQGVVDGDLKPGRAAERLGLTSRQVQRLANRYRSEGPVDLNSGTFEDRTATRSAARSRTTRGS